VVVVGIVELMFRFQFRLSGDMVPSTRIEHDLFTGGQILSYEFRDMLRAGEVEACKGGIARSQKMGSFSLTAPQLKLMLSSLALVSRRTIRT